nr:hypothetical protein [Tanacetum cinerariifolium]
MKRLDGRHARMEGTSGWKARPDGRTSRWKAHPDGRHVRMKGTPGWKGRLDERYIALTTRPPFSVRHGSFGNGYGGSRMRSFGMVLSNPFKFGLLTDATPMRLRTLTSWIANRNFNRYFPSDTSHMEHFTNTVGYEENMCSYDGPSTSYSDPSVFSMTVRRILLR